MCSRSHRSDEQQELSDIHKVHSHTAPSCVLSGCDGQSNSSAQAADSKAHQALRARQFDSFDHMRSTLNRFLPGTTDFVEAPQPRPECQILTFGSKDKKVSKQYVLCPEQDCESLVFYFDQSKSMIEIFELHETVEWKGRVEQFHERYDAIYKKDKWTWESKDDRKSWHTKEARDVLNASQSQQKYERQLHMRRQSHGKILAKPLSKNPSCIQQMIHLVQLFILNQCQRETSSSICNGSMRFSNLIEGSRKMKECILHTVI